MYSLPDSPSVVKLPPGNDFCTRCLTDHGLTADDLVTHPVPGFIEGFRIVNHDETGKPRPDLSAIRYNRTEGKYISPKGQGVVPYAAFSDTWELWAKATSKFIVEGELDAANYLKHGHQAIGIRGVYGWKLGQDFELHPMLEKRIRPTDTVNIVVDGDWRTNSQVHVGLWLLYRVLRRKGVRVNVVDIEDPKKDISDLCVEWAAAGQNVSAKLAQLPTLDKVPTPIDKRQPTRIAEVMNQLKYDGCNLVCWQNRHYRHENGWVLRSERNLKTDVYRFLEEVNVPGTTHTVSSVYKALTACVDLDDSGHPVAPFFIHPPENPPKGELLCCANGLLDLETFELRPHSPNYFDLNRGVHRYDPKATCPRFLQTMDDIFPGDPQAIALYQEWFGYCLTSDTSRHKILLAYGEPRSGKSMLANLAKSLVGASAYWSFDFEALVRDFGMAASIGKKVGVYPDARLSKRTDGQVLVKRLLSMSGKDGITISRKYQDDWEGTGTVKLWIISNVVPSLPDSGGALARRFLAVEHKVSFFGVEDLGREDELVRTEMPGILNWALEGLVRLRARDAKEERGAGNEPCSFTQPQSGERSLRDLTRMSNPMEAFIDEECELGDEHFAPTGDLFEAYKRFHVVVSGVVYPESETSFSAEFFRAAESLGLSHARKRPPGGGRRANPVRGFRGARLLGGGEKF